MEILVKKTLAFISIILIASFSSSIALAGKSGRVNIKRLASVDTGVSIVWAEGGWGTAASNSCSTETGVLAFDSTTNAGKSLLSLAMAAYVSEKTVEAITDDNQCLHVGGFAPVIKRLDVIN